MTVERYRRLLFFDWIAYYYTASRRFKAIMSFVGMIARCKVHAAAHHRDAPTLSTATDLINVPRSGLREGNDKMAWAQRGNGALPTRPTEVPNAGSTPVAITMQYRRQPNS